MVEPDQPFAALVGGVLVANAAEPRGGGDGPAELSLRTNRLIRLISDGFRARISLTSTLGTLRNLLFYQTAHVRSEANGFVPAVIAEGNHAAVNGNVLTSDE